MFIFEVGKLTSLRDETCRITKMEKNEGSVRLVGAGARGKMGKVADT